MCVQHPYKDKPTHQGRRENDGGHETQKYLAGLNMSEDEAINVYTFLVVFSRLFGGKRTTKLDIAYFPTYGKWRDKSLQTGLGYDLEKMLYPVHR